MHACQPTSAKVEEGNKIERLLAVCRRSTLAAGLPTHTSLHLWKERKFPLILLLKGSLVAYPWPRFLSDFHYGAGLKPKGRTFRIAEKSFANGPFATEAELFERIVSEFPVKVSAA
jgi:hypothetical protein